MSLHGSCRTLLKPVGGPYRAVVHIFSAVLTNETARDKVCVASRDIDVSCGLPAENQREIGTNETSEARIAPVNNGAARRIDAVVTALAPVEVATHVDRPCVGGLETDTRMDVKKVLRTKQRG